MSCLMGLRSSSLEIYSKNMSATCSRGWTKLLIKDSPSSSLNWPRGGKQKFLRDLLCTGRKGAEWGAEGFGRVTDLKLGVGPARNLNNHVEDGLVLVGIQGNVVEGGDGDAILLDVDPVLEGVRGGDLAGGVSHVDWC